MIDIPNTQYITINKDGIFVGGKPATKYRGQSILWLKDMPKYFAEIQKLNKDVAELHVLSSETAVVGNPSGKRGPYAWCRVVFNDGSVGAWVFKDDEYSSAKDCAEWCAQFCAYAIARDKVFGSSVLKAKYIIINKDGIFGGKPATQYRGLGIYFAQDAVNIFKDFQSQNKNVAELQVLPSETPGKPLKSGNPSDTFGKYPWCRVKFDDGNVGPWILDSSYEYSSESSCAYYCVWYAVLNLCQNVDFRFAVLGKSLPRETKKLGKVDLSVFEGKTLQLNGYEIVVRKIAEKTK